MEEEIDIKEIILKLWDKRWFIISITAIITVTTFIIYALSHNVAYNIESSFNPKPLHYAETHFVIGTADLQKTITIPQGADSTSQITVADQTRVIPPEVLINTYYEIMKSTASLTKISKELDLNMDANRLASSISFAIIPESNYFSLTVAHTDSEKVVQIATKLMEEFEKNLSKAYSIDKVSIIDAPYLLTGADFTRSTTAAAISTPKSIAKASFNGTVKALLISAFAGVILSSGIILFKEMLDNRIKSKKDLEKLTNSKIVISLCQKRADDYNPISLLRVRLDDTKNILVTSPERNDNLIYAADTLADSFAKSFKSVLLIDLNFDRSILVKKYNLRNLFEFANKNNEIKKIVKKSVNGLYDIIYMDSESTSYLTEVEIKKMMTALNKNYDVVVINSDNLFENPHGLALSQVVNNTVLVAHENVTTTEDYLKADEFITGNKEYLFLQHSDFIF